MTFVQQKRTASLTTFRITLISMIGLILAGVVTLVILYNQTVAARHATRELQDRITLLEGDNADREEQLMSRLDSRSLAAFAASRGLVEERAPSYLQAHNDPWAFASRF
jgi:hypothetical protein